MKRLDLPPIWLFAFVVASWATKAGFESGALQAFGWLLIIAAAALVFGAILAFRRARTTIIPHRQPSNMISDGVFAISRNPIYLADVLILVGLSLVWGSWIGLILTLPFLFVLHVRFIAKEEARLKEAFGEDFEAYAKRVRRWL